MTPAGLVIQKGHAHRVASCILVIVYSVRFLPENATGNSFSIYNTCSKNRMMGDSLDCMTTVHVFTKRSFLGAIRG